MDPRLRGDDSGEAAAGMIAKIQQNPKQKNGSLKREAPAEFPTFLAISQKV